MKVALSVLIPLVFLATVATAGPITPNAGWYGFCFAGVGSPATEGCQNEGIGVAGNTMTFTVAEPVTLKVTDAFSRGDQFDVFVNSVLSFTTALVPAGEGSVSNPDLAFADPTYSHGSVLLEAGSYSVDIFVAASPWESGGAYVGFESGVPEPATWLLAVPGLALLTLRGRIRR
jgi:hypothetical protein